MQKKYLTRFEYPTHINRMVLVYFSSEKIFSTHVKESKKIQKRDEERNRNTNKWRNRERERSKREWREWRDMYIERENDRNK